MNRSMLEGSELLQFSLPDQGGLGEVRSVHITSTGRRGKLCSLAMFKQAKQVQSPSEFDCKEVGTEGALSTFEIILILFSFFLDRIRVYLQCGNQKGAGQCVCLSCNVIPRFADPESIILG